MQHWILLNTTLSFERLNFGTSSMIFCLGKPDFPWKALRPHYGHAWAILGSKFCLLMI